MTRLAKLVCIVAICFSTLSPIAALADDAPVLTVVNNVGDVITFWIKSETKREWNRAELKKSAPKDFSLVSPDRFEMAVSDLRGNEFYSGLQTVKQFVANYPGSTLYIEGDVKQEVKTANVYNPYTRRTFLQQYVATYISE